MENLKRGNEIKTKFAEIRGLNCNNTEWNLNYYIQNTKFQKTQVKIYFMYKFFMSFEIMSQLKELFNGYDLKIEAEGDRLVLTIGGF